MRQLPRLRRALLGSAAVALFAAPALALLHGREAWVAALLVAEGLVGLLYMMCRAFLDLRARKREGERQEDVNKTTRLLLARFRRQSGEGSREERREAARTLRYLGEVNELRGGKVGSRGS